MRYTKYKYSQTNDGDENVFWITMSDLLLGLVIIFLVLFVFAITGFTQSKIKENETKYEVTQKIADELNKNNIHVDIDKYAGTIKISDLELFELNSWELSENGKTFMAKFVPIYLNTIMKDKKIKDNITAIIVEGHTDSQTFANAKTDEDKYYKNMDLSLKRASSVGQYIIYTQNNYQKDLYKLLTISGKGSSEPIKTNGKEDFSKSRRVELKIAFKDQNLANALKR
jgi:chemotaxis protein MotB